MKRIIRLTESDLRRIVNRVLNEQPINTSGPINYTEQIEEIFQDCNQGDNVIIFENFIQECESCVELYTKILDLNKTLGISTEDTLDKNVELSDLCSEELMLLFGEDYEDVSVSGEFFMCMNKKFSERI
jgi:hypothetical protein